VGRMPGRTPGRGCPPPSPPPSSCGSQWRLRSSGIATRVVLVDRPVPASALVFDLTGEPTSLLELTAGPCVIWTFPGLGLGEVRLDRRGRRPECDRTHNACTAQARAFDEHLEDFRALGVDVIGISGRAPSELSAWARAVHCPRIWSDMDLRLSGLGVPLDIDSEGEPVYERTVSYVEDGHIKVTFPPSGCAPGDLAPRVLQWLRGARHGIAPSHLS
jgi:peroxiredoxin